jgi:hypothetical protein
VRSEVADDGLVFGQDVVWKSHNPIIRPISPRLASISADIQEPPQSAAWRRPRPGAEKPRESLSRSFHPLGVLLLGRVLRPTEMPAKTEASTGSILLGPWGRTSRAHPRTSLAGRPPAPRRAATLPDLRDPLRGPGVAVSVTRLSDNKNID